MKINKSNENRWKDEKLIMIKNNDRNGNNKSIINNDRNVNKNNKCNEEI